MKKPYLQPQIQVIPLQTESPLACSNDNASMSYGNYYDQIGGYEQFSLEEDNGWGIDWHVNDK